MGTADKATGLPQELLMPELDRMSLMVYGALACNIRCKFCYQETFDQELNPEIVYEKLRPVYEKTAKCHYLGGEPTIIKTALPTLQYVSSVSPGTSFSLATNGTALTSDWIQTIVQNNMSITMSLNASGPSAYAKLLRKGNAARLWENAYLNLVRLIKCRQAYKSPSSLGVTMVIAAETVPDIEDFVRLACKLKVNASLLFDCRPHILPLDDARRALEKVVKLKAATAGIIELNDFNAPGELTGSGRTVFSQEDLAAYRLEFLRSLEAYRLPVIADLNPESHPEVLSLRPAAAIPELKPPPAAPTVLEGRDICPSPWNEMIVMASGEVLACCSTPNFSLGNLNHHESIESIWHGENAVHLRTLMLNGNYRYCPKSCPRNRAPATSLHDETIQAHGHFYAERYEEALPIFEAMRAMGDCTSREYYCLAYCYQRTGQLEKAIECYTAAWKKGYDEQAVLSLRAECYRALGLDDPGL